MSADGSGNGTSTHVDVHALHFAVGSGSQVLAMFAGNDGGVWASQDVFSAATVAGRLSIWADLNTNTGNAEYFAESDAVLSGDFDSSGDR